MSSMADRNENGDSTEPLLVVDDENVLSNEDTSPSPEIPDNDVRLVRLRWEGDVEDLGVAVVASSATVADIRIAIAEQFHQERGFEGRDDFRFVVDGMSITSAQERLIPVATLSSVLLRAYDAETPKDSSLVEREIETEQLADQDQIVVSMSSSIQPSLSAQTTLSSDVGKMLPISQPSTSVSRRKMIANVHISGNDVAQISNMHELVQIIKDIQSDKAKKNVTWIDVQTNDPKELQRIGCCLGLHPLTIEDISVKATRQKVEGFRQYMVVILHGLLLPYEDREAFEGLSFVISSDIVLTVHRSEVVPLDYVRSRLNKVHGNVLPYTATLVHAIIDCIVDYDLLIVDQCTQEVDTLEDLVYMLSQSEQSDLLRRMGIVRKKISILRQDLWVRRDVITQLMSREWREFLTGVRVAYFRDVLDHVVTMIQKLELAQDMLNSLQSTYMAKVSIEVSEASNNINLVMRNISYFATAFLPMTFVTGLFGMNVRVPFQTGNSDESLGPFFIILFFMFILIIPFILLLRRMRC